MTKTRERSAVDMHLYVRNGTSDVISGLKMQTCAYLRLLDEFSEKTTAGSFSIPLSR